MTVTGMVLVAFGCAWVGFRAAEELRRKVQHLEQVIAGLKLMEQELELDAPDLTSLMERLELRTSGAVKQLFSSCKTGMARLDQESFGQMWKRMVKEQSLDPEETAVLSTLGDTLGRCDCKAQCRTVETVCRQLEQVRSRWEAEYRQQGKMYRIMGMSGGAFLIILLL